MKKWNAAAVLRLRRRLGWTQEKLGNELGVHQATIAKWETGVLELRRTNQILLGNLEERMRKELTA